MMAGMIALILTGLLRGGRTQRSLVFENLALRHQLAVLQRTAPRPRLRTADRLFRVLLSRLWSGWTDAVSVVQPATVIRWQRGRLQARLDLVSFPERFPPGASQKDSPTPGARPQVRFYSVMSGSARVGARRSGGGAG